MCVDACVRAQELGELEELAECLSDRALQAGRNPVCVRDRGGEPRLRPVCVTACLCLWPRLLLFFSPQLLPPSLSLCRPFPPFLSFCLTSLSLPHLPAVTFAQRRGSARARSPPFPPAPESLHEPREGAPGRVRACQGRGKRPRARARACAGCERACVSPCVCACVRGRPTGVTSTSRPWPAVQRETRRRHGRQGRAQRWGKLCVWG